MRPRKISTLFGVAGAVIMCGLMFTSQSATATPVTDSFTLVDLTDTIIPQFTTSSSGVGFNITCLFGSESCTIFAESPSLTISNVLPNNTQFFIAEAGGTLISDEATITTTGPGSRFGIPFNASYTLSFTSDSDAIPGDLGTCVSAGGCTITEDGTVQNLLSVTWSDGTVDSYSFQSDLDPVPEPPSFALMFPGFLVLARFSRGVLRGRNSLTLPDRAHQQCEV